MRGLPAATSASRRPLGITPAHAGLTNGEAHRRNPDGGPPRACGAYKILNVFILASMGSPPRMRGLRNREYQKSMFNGITPAHAGLTCRLQCSHIRQWDHPRACGAYYDKAILYSSTGGSPPRMRGLPGLKSMLLSVFGITPAHAGLTAAFCS